MSRKMFLVDDLLLAPGKAAYALFHELARKAQEEWLNDDTIKQELQQLYEMLESGRLSDKDFEAQECRLLERLEQIARIKFQDKWGPAEESPTIELASTVSALPPLPSVPVPSPPLDVPPALAALPAVTPAAPLPCVSPPAPAPAAPAAPAPAALAPAAPAPAALAFAVPAPPPPSARPAPPAPPVFSDPALAGLAFALPAPSERAALSAPPMFAPPAPPVSAPTPPTALSPDGVLTMNQIVDCALRAVAPLRMRVSAVVSVVPAENSWNVSLELVERRGIPDSNDILGVYELRLDAAGRVTRYERTQMRRRCDFAR